MKESGIKEWVSQMGSDAQKGLSEEEAKRRLAEEGPNALREAKKKTVFASFLEQLNDPLIYVLLASAAVSLALREAQDAVIILVVVTLNAVTGVLQEGKAQRALDSLKQMTQPTARVIREGREKEIPASRLVKGDLVCLEAGMQAPADLRLIECHALTMEESALTGEALPVKKEVSALKDPEIGWEGKEIPLGDRQHMAFMSTIATGGRGLGIVTATGMETEIGKIADMISEGKEEATPLQKRLGELGKVLSLLSLAVCCLLFLVALLQRRPLFDMLLTAISLAVAAVPEGLPAVVTLCLALSVTRMAKVNTIIRRLPSVETLGAVSVVCSDKTGTLTQNRMTVLQCFCNQRLTDAGMLEEKEKQQLLTGFLLCCDATLEEGQRMGDPTELALLDLGERYRLTRKELEKEAPRLAERAFDSNRKMMTTLHSTPGGKVAYTKGAPDVVLSRCNSILLDGRVLPMNNGQKKKILETTAAMSSQALRTLALAKTVEDTKMKEEGMTFLGLVGMQDPIRPEAVGAVAKMKQAGVTTVMITGDHADTAFAIAKQLGIARERSECMTGSQLDALTEGEEGTKLDKIRVFARVSPAHKVKIVKSLKGRGHVVAMTGDGVNDAPSLKVADVGIAMGKNGTDVARQASDLILTDDNFATIERAMEEGRGVYENIKKSVIFLLSSNLGEILTMFVAVLCGLASPLKSAHILWINLITDSLPALALGVDKNDRESLMGRPPRKAKESLFADRGFSRTLLYGGLIAFISLSAFFLAPLSFLKAQGQGVDWHTMALLLGRSDILARAQTYAFTVLGMSQLFHAVGMRDVKKSVFLMDHRENPLMIAACLLGVLLQVLVTENPFLVAAFGTVRLSGMEWALLSGLAAFPLLAHELLVLLNRTSKEETALSFSERKRHKEIAETIY